MAGTGSPRSLLVEISKKIFDIRRRFLTARCQKSQKDVKKNNRSEFCSRSVEIDRSVGAILLCMMSVLVYLGWSRLVCGDKLAG